MIKPSFEHVCDTDARFDRSLFVPDLYLGKRKDGTIIDHGAFRLRVFHDADFGGQTSIAEEDTTSEAATAQAIDGRGKELVLTEEQVRWMHKQLGELIVWLDAKEGKGT